MITRQKIICEPCGGEGRLYRSRYGGNDPNVWCIGGCPDCDGKGEVWVKVDEEEELEAWEEEHRAEAPAPPTCGTCGRLLTDGETANGMCDDCIHDWDMTHREAAD